MVVLIEIRKALQRRSLIRQTGRQMEFQVQMERKKTQATNPGLSKGVKQGVFRRCLAWWEPDVCERR